MTGEPQRHAEELERRYYDREEEEGLAVERPPGVRGPRRRGAAPACGFDAPPGKPEPPPPPPRARMDALERMAAANQAARAYLAAVDEPPSRETGLLRRRRLEELRQALERVRL